MLIFNTFDFEGGLELSEGTAKETIAVVGTISQV
jgi:hypothetical protein